MCVCFSKFMKERDIESQLKDLHTKVLEVEDHL